MYDSITNATITSTPETTKDTLNKILMNIRRGNQEIQSRDGVDKVGRLKNKNKLSLRVKNRVETWFERVLKPEANQNI